MSLTTRRTDRPLEGTALVTGASSGIGAEFARQLAERGLDLVLVARSRARLEALASELSERHAVRADVLVADLATPDGVAAVRERLLSQDAPIEVLVNNAGSGLHSSVLGEDLSDHELAFDLMVRAVFHLGNAAGRAMRERDHGVIVNIASVASYVNMGNYSAVKAWVRTWSQSMANELHGTGVQVVTLNPGWVRTEFHERAGISTSNIPSFLWIDVRELVAQCLRDIDAGRTFSVPSRRFQVLRFGAQHAPRALVDAVSRGINRGRAHKPRLPHLPVGIRGARE